MTETHILHKAEKAVYKRHGQYGKPEDSFKQIAELWTAYLGQPIKPHQVAELMILLKIGRSMNNNYVDDNYADIAGYAENAARLQETEKQ